MGDRRDPFRVDRTAFSVARLDDRSDEPAYWLAKSPRERLRALELMRRTIYGYNPATARLSRFFEVAEQETS